MLRACGRYGARVWNCSEEVVGQRLVAGVGRSVVGHGPAVWSFVKDLGSLVTSLEPWWVAHLRGYGEVEAGGRLVCVAGWHVLGL